MEQHRKYSKLFLKRQIYHDGQFLVGIYSPVVLALLSEP